ncbi:MAG: response regulator [Chloroflexi bacterium]|nr:response regulator [Chloroflexota bacterium]
MMCSHRRVLVVDDQPSIRAMLEAILSDEGYRVDVAEHGAAALRIALTSPPCLILLDLRMPVMDGESFIAEYRHTGGHRAPILILTAERGNEHMVDELGVAGVLQKPFDLTELLDMVDWHVSRHCHDSPPN